MKALLFVIAIVSACSSKLSLDPVEGGSTSGEYAKVLEEWTRAVEVVPATSGFLNVISGDATYRSWPFRMAYSEQFAEDHHLSPGRKQELIAEQRAAHEAGHEFFFSGFTAVRRSLELDSEESAWRISLVTDGGIDAEPIVVDEIRRPTASIRAYYPYVTATRNTFLIRFPRDIAGRQVLPPGTKWFSLRFDGALGHAELKWELE